MSAIKRQELTQALVKIAGVSVQVVPTTDDASEKIHGTERYLMLAVN